VRARLLESWRLRLSQSRGAACGSPRWSRRPGRDAARQARPGCCCSASRVRRAELVALDVANLTFEAEGLRVNPAQQGGPGGGQEIAIPQGTRLRPVAAVQDWLEVAAIGAGTVFRGIDRHGRVLGPLTAQSVTLIVK
jgi:hypothetical protein